MEASSTVVIKVKYGDVLRRFNAQIVDYELNFSMNELREKILNLFSFNSDAELMLTYVDEDNDVVALVDDDDLSDVVRQGLNPLRITVKVFAEKNGRLDNRSSASSTPLRSPRVQQPFQNLNTGVSEILRTVPEPVRDILMKLSTDLAYKASSTAPDIALLIDNLSKVGSSYLGQLPESQCGVKSSTDCSVPESSRAATETKDSEPFKVDPAVTGKVLSNLRPELSSKNDDRLEKLNPEATMKKNEVKIQNVPGGSMESSPSDFIRAAELESQSISVVQSGNDSSPNIAPVNFRPGKKEKVKKIINLNGKSHFTSHPQPSANNVEKVSKSCATTSNLPSIANNIPTSVSNPSELKLGSNPAIGASDPKKGNYVSIWNPCPDNNFTGSFSSPTPAYGCPFSGVTMENVSAVLPHPASETVPFRRSFSQNDGSGNVFHRGVRCDGCGVHPITGPRFKSKVKVDYDLCSICFEEMGNHNDYIRMDRPVVYRHHMSFKGLHDAVYRGFKVKQGSVKLDSRFIQDVNIFDGTVMAPLSAFTKIWRMRNNGTTVWPQKTQLVWIGGDKLSNELSVEVQIPADGLMIDQELDIAVDFISPELPGRYISYWRLASPSGQKFGQRVWVLIQVDASGKGTPRGSVRNLNLNLPPVSSCLTGPEFINVNPEPIVSDSHPETHDSTKIVELVQPNTDQELKFPINDSLLVGNGASSSLSPSASAPISYPIIDLSDVAPALSFAPPPMLYPLAPSTPSPSRAPNASAQPSLVDIPKKEQFEEKLLKELEEMGFKQVDLNKEILRIHEYDLEQTVDDLCGVAEWDPILEELQEMGFVDTEMNKMLLKKNNGSIKRVVMDLIAREKI